jgi:hypothetical protein
MSANTNTAGGGAGGGTTAGEVGAGVRWYEIGGNNGNHTNSPHDGLAAVTPDMRQRGG